MRASSSVTEGPTLYGPGRVYTRLGESFKGDIDDLKIWDRALSETAIRTGMQSILTGQEQGLVAYYRFDDGYFLGLPGQSRKTSTGHAQDSIYTSVNDWLNGWQNAATLRGNAAFVTSTSILATHTDIDADGMADWWEMQYFGTLDMDGTGDADEDELTDLYEFLARTNPQRGSLSDLNDDLDDDGMDNRYEQEIGTNPRSDDTDDDGICLKSTGPAACEDITITNCVASSHCNAIKTGTESTGGFKHVTISDCSVKPSASKEKVFGRKEGITGITVGCVDGGICEDINISNIKI